MKAYVEPEEITLLEKATTNLRDRLLIRLLFHLGCRVSEALGLAVEDMDFNQGNATIKHLKRRLKLSRRNYGAGPGGGAAPGGADRLVARRIVNVKALSIC